MERVSSKNSTSNLIYILYLVNLVVPFLGLVGVILAYGERDRADYVARSHHEFQITTFWHSILWLIIGIITTPILIGVGILCFLYVWWTIRAVIGLRASLDGEPYPRPGNWLW